MKVIGLCGGSGSGKSTVSTYFAAYNILPINTDEIYHALTVEKTPCVCELESAFGAKVVNSDGSLNRKALSAVVFSDKAKLDLLNKITHAYVLREVRRIIARATEDNYFAVLVDAPLLFESGFDSECDAVVAVVADEEIKLSRIVERDGITEDAAKKRLASQLSDEYLRQRADYVIVNNSSCALSAAVGDIINKIKINE